MLTAPLASNWTVMSWVTMAGSTLSSTVTVAVAVLTLPLLSVTVNVTVLGPTSAQVKLEISRVMLSMPQALLEPLLSCSGVMLTAPVASS